MCTIAKTAFITILATAIFFEAAAQRYLFKCFQQVRHQYEHVGDTLWVDTSFFMIVDFEKKKISLRNKASDQIQITAFRPLRTTENGNTIVGNALDKEGTRCDIELTLFRQRSFHIATLVVRYTTFAYAYRLKDPE